MKKLVLPGHGYTELGAELNSLSGLKAWGEVGYRPKPGLTFFGRGEANQAGARVLIGGRYEW